MVVLTIGLILYLRKISILIHSENLTIEYDGEGGPIGYNGDPAPAFISALRIDDGGEYSDDEEGNNDGIPDATDIFIHIDPSGDDDYKFIGISSTNHTKIYRLQKSKISQPFYDPVGWKCTSRSA